MRFGIYVRPGSRTDAVGGTYEAGEGRSELVVRVRARSVEGQANRAVLEALADATGSRLSAVQIVSGLRSRHKIVEIDGVAAEVIAALRDRVG